MLRLAGDNCNLNLVIHKEFDLRNGPVLHVILLTDCAWGVSSRARVTEEGSTSYSPPAFVVVVVVVVVV